MFGPLNVFRSLPEASSTHSATAQQSPQGSSMKGLCAVVGIGTTAVLHSVLIKHIFIMAVGIKRTSFTAVITVSITLKSQYS